MGTIWRAGGESAKQRYHRNIYGFCVSIRESHQDNLQSYHQSGWNSNAESRVSKHPVGSPLPRACWKLCCGLRCLLRPPVIRYFPIFLKDFFLKTRDCKSRFRIGDCQCSELHFCLVWKTWLYLYCCCKIPCFVDFFGLS